MLDIDIIKKLELPNNENIKKNIGNYWLSIALLEHASIGAFSKLSLELLGLCAPAYLLESTYKAGLDEINHAKITFSLASHYLEKNIAPGSIKGILGSKIKKTNLEKIGLESLVYGYIGEGISAEIMKESSKISEEINLKLIYTSIAEDEQRHSQLGLDILIWCIAREKVLGKKGLYKKLEKILSTKELFLQYFQNNYESDNYKMTNNTLNKYGIIDITQENRIKIDFFNQSFDIITDLIKEK